MTLEAGRRFGRYELLRRLGRGGMAQVFLAAYEPMPGARRLVALKVIAQDLRDEDDFVRMFFDEARVLMGLYHANLDRVVDVGEVDSVPYLALDYLPGRDLALVLRRHEQVLGPLPLDVAAHVVSKVAAGLAHAHGRIDEAGRSLGIVHRDVTPENIIVTFEGAVKVVDFGIARGAMREMVTEPGLVKGKPAYMAPEQLLGRPIDHRVDVFATGVLLHRLVTGRHPFGVRSNDEATFGRILHETPAPAHLLRPQVPEALSLVILRALEKQPADRYPSQAHLVGDLEGVMRTQGWFPSDRRLGELVTRLFPEAVAAARRLAAEPGNAEAAEEASYLSTALRLPGAPDRAPPAPRDRRLDAVPAGPDEEATEAATRTATATETESAAGPAPADPEPTRTVPAGPAPEPVDRRLLAPIPEDDDPLSGLRTRTAAAPLVEATHLAPPPAFDGGTRAGAEARDEGATVVDAPPAPPPKPPAPEPPALATEPAETADGARPSAPKDPARAPTGARRTGPAPERQSGPVWRSPLVLLVAALGLFLLSLVLSRLLAG